LFKPTLNLKVYNIASLDISVGLEGYLNLIVNFGKNKTKKNKSLSPV